MRPPLPVDVTTTWWDYVFDGADVLAGWVRRKRLLIAAFAYLQAVGKTPSAGSKRRRSTSGCGHSGNSPSCTIIVTWSQYIAALTNRSPRTV